MHKRSDTYAACWRRSFGVRFCTILYVYAIMQHFVPVYCTFRFHRIGLVWRIMFIVSSPFVLSHIMFSCVFCSLIWLTPSTLLLCMWESNELVLELCAVQRRTIFSYLKCGFLFVQIVCTVHNTVHITIKHCAEAD